MLLKARIALAAGVGLALAPVAPLALARVPRGIAPARDSAEAKTADASRSAMRDNRPDSRKDPKAAQLTLRRMPGRHVRRRPRWTGQIQRFWQWIQGDGPDQYRPSRRAEPD